MANEKLKLKLSLKKETLRELSDSQLGALDQVVGGTNTSANCCGCTILEARTAPPADPPLCEYTAIY
jgi:hypothetical protein